ncbi:MAG: Uma2 family endonuclease, partial [Planctomycetaceae bacterium]
RGEKFENYCLIPSLRHYVLISQARRRMDVFTRDEEGGWRLAYASEPGSRVELEFIRCELALEDLYAGIELDPGETNGAPDRNGPE